MDAVPVTPPQTYVSQQRPRETFRGHDHRPNLTPSSLTLPMLGYAGVRYDIQHLSPVSAGRAAEGIEAGSHFSYISQSLYGFMIPMYNDYRRIESRVTV